MRYLQLSLSLFPPLSLSLSSSLSLPSSLSPPSLPPPLSLSPSLSLSPPLSLPPPLSLSPLSLSSLFLPLSLSPLSLSPPSLSPLLSLSPLSLSLPSLSHPSNPLHIQFMTTLEVPGLEILESNEQCNHSIAVASDGACVYMMYVLLDWPFPRHPGMLGRPFARKRYHGQV